MKTWLDCVSNVGLYGKVKEVTPCLMHLTCCLETGPLLALNISTPISNSRALFCQFCIPQDAYIATGNVSCTHHKSLSCLLQTITKFKHVLFA